MFDSFNSTQILLSIMIVLLGVTLVIVGIQLFFVLKDLRHRPRWPFPLQTPAHRLPTCGEFPGIGNVLEWPQLHETGPLPQALPIDS